MLSTHRVTSKLMRTEYMLPTEPPRIGIYVDDILIDNFPFEAWKQAETFMAELRNDAQRWHIFEQKINAIKTVRTITGCSLKEAKICVEVLEFNR